LLEDASLVINSFLKKKAMKLEVLGEVVKVPRSMMLTKRKEE
jgi:hypothetical protein